MAPLVSIVLPVYAPHPQYFREAVRSILDQTVPDLELIIVEDPSPSSGEEILSGLGDARVRHQVNPARTSLPEQHNRGLALAAGRFLCRFDADDISEPHRVERQLEFLRAHPDVNVVSSALLVIDEEGTAIAVRNYPLSHEAIRRTFRRSNPIANSAVMFRREVYDRFGGWRTDSPLPAQDYEWYSRLAAAGVRFANLPDPLVRYRLHSGAIKATKVRDTIRSTVETKRRYWTAEMSLMDRLVLLGERMLVHAPPSLVLMAFRRMKLQRRRRT
ncbi:MAG TPA: glycosyltransferase [Thermoanaerobaculia bacterium]|nr:glycosyltransferase [Thermoanaerobaculia bacterium]